VKDPKNKRIDQFRELNEYLRQNNSDKEVLFDSIKHKNWIKVQFANQEPRSKLTRYE